MKLDIIKITKYKYRYFLRIFNKFVRLGNSGINMLTVSHRFIILLLCIALNSIESLVIAQNADSSIFSKPLKINESVKTERAPRLEQKGDTLIFNAISNENRPFSDKFTHTAQENRELLTQNMNNTFARNMTHKFSGKITLNPTKKHAFIIRPSLTIEDMYNGRDLFSRYSYIYTDAADKFIGKRFLKNKSLEVSIGVNDLLNNNILSYWHTISNSGISDGANIGIGRYFSLQCI